VGGNAFRHESGIHQDGVLKKRTTYEIIDPADVGFTGEGLVLGKHSGRHAFKQRLDTLGIKLNDAELDKAFSRFKILADKKKTVYDEDLLSIVEDEFRKVTEVWQLSSLQISSGTNTTPQANVKLKSKGKLFVSSSSGDGPVDALYKAIDKITKIKGELLDYSIQSVTRGKDALGEVSIKIKAKNQEVIGGGASTDILEASAKAYLNAINKVLSKTAKSTSLTL
jgi:2-isopropylmalate synthase